MSSLILEVVVVRKGRHGGGAGMGKLLVTYRHHTRHPGQSQPKPGPGHPPTPSEERRPRPRPSTQDARKPRTRRRRFTDAAAASVQPARDAVLPYHHDARSRMAGPRVAPMRVCRAVCVVHGVLCPGIHARARGESGPSPESPLRRMDPAEEGSPALPDHVVRVISYFPRRDDAMAPTRAQAMPCVGCGVGCGVGGRRAAQRCHGGVSLLP